MINKKFILDITPPKLLSLIRYIKRSPTTFFEYLRDGVRYTKFSSVVDYRDDPEKLVAIITATYHNIEKGLSLPSPRPGFGKDNIQRLVSLIEEYLNKYGPRESLMVPISVLEQYCDFNKKNKIFDSLLEAKIMKLKSTNILKDHVLNTSLGGVVRRTEHEIINVVSKVPSDFFFLRHSVRQFSDKAVELEAIEKAILIAQKSPVVCNRQSGKVYTITDKDLIKSTLSIQGGARGFSEEVRALFCITSDLRNFNGAAERYQGWIDGGMFAMSFIYGLHHQGLGSCCLNWSKTHKQDAIMKSHLSIPDSELIIMFVAAGHLKNEFNVAKSERKPISDIHTVIDR